MPHLNRQSLYSLEDYSGIRTEFRAKVMAEKERRVIILDNHVRLQFENKLLMHYQIQEMLRIEKIFEAAGIQEELDAYNPLIPDGDNWKATMMIQYDDVEVRRQKLKELVDIENQVWMQAGDSERVYGIADEDMERADSGKTSAVHFMRFQLTDNFISKVKNGEPIAIGISHPRYQVTVPQVSETLRASLVSDLG